MLRLSLSLALVLALCASGSAFAHCDSTTLAGNWVREIPDPGMTSFTTETWSIDQSRFSFVSRYFDDFSNRTGAGASDPYIEVLQNYRAVPTGNCGFTLTDGSGTYRILRNFDQPNGEKSERPIESLKAEKQVTVNVSNAGKTLTVFRSNASVAEIYVRQP